MMARTAPKPKGYGAKYISAIAQKAPIISWAKIAIRIMVSAKVKQVPLNHHNILMLCQPPNVNITKLR
jgi:hypothetical protein